MHRDPDFTSHAYGKWKQVNLKELPPVTPDPRTNPAPTPEASFPPSGNSSSSHHRRYRPDLATAGDYRGEANGGGSKLSTSRSAGALAAMSSSGGQPTWRPRGQPNMAAMTAAEPAGPAEVLPLSKFNKKDGNPPPPFWRNPAVLGGPARRRVWASSGIFALLLVCSLAYSSTHRASADRAALRHQEVAGGPATGVAAVQPVYVEFTAPGLYLPLRDALDVSQPFHPLEQPLLDVFPTAEELALISAGPLRPTLEQQIKAQQEEARQMAKLAAAKAMGRPTKHREVREQQRQEEEAMQQAQQQEGQEPQAVVLIDRRRLGEETGASASQGEDAAGAAHGAAGAQAGEVVVAVQGSDYLQEGQQAGYVVEEELVIDESEWLPQQQQQQQQKEQQRGEEEIGGGGNQSRSRRALRGEAGQAAKAGATGEAEVPIREEPLGPPRLLIGVTSACCTEKAYRRRQAVRDTWAGLARSRHAGVVAVKFVLAQPESPGVLARWLPLLEEEVRQYNDTLVVRGPDTYHNLPNKTIRLMRYAATHPLGYTHVLKTDDDCYVRLPMLLRALEPWPPLLPDQADTPHGSTADTHGIPRSWLKGRSMLPEVYTDGLATYSLRDLTKKLGKWRYVDDRFGNAISLGQLGNYTRQGVHPYGWHYGVTGATAAVLLHEHEMRTRGKARLERVYMGAVENKHGFFPIRDPKSKWYMPYELLPDSAVPFGVKYAAGWGYLLSRDMVMHVVKKVNYWQTQPDKAPAWFKPMDWEDVLVGLLLMDVVPAPENHPGFRAAWRACPNTTAVTHMDVDAPVLMSGLYAQELSGLWAKKPVQCSSGAFLPGDYNGWKRWRDGLTDVERL